MNRPATWTPHLCGRNPAPAYTAQSPVSQDDRHGHARPPLGAIRRHRLSARQGCIYRLGAGRGVVAEGAIAAAPDGPDDPAVPRQLAEHADRRRLDPAVDPVSIIAPVRARPLAQRDDARRPGAGGRHPGRRRDGRDREHPPQPRPGEAAACRRSSTARSRSPAPAFVSTLCICIVFVPVVFLDGAGEVPVHAAGAGGRVRDAGLVPAVAHARADDGPTTCCAKEARASSTAQCRRPRPIWRVASRLRSRRSSASARAYGGVLAWALEHRRAACFGAFVAASRVAASLLPLRRPRLLPDRRRRASSGCTCARPPARASRRPSATSAAVEDDDPRDHSRRRDRDLILDNIGMPVQRHQPGARRQRDDRHGRRRDPGRAQAAHHAPDAGLHARAARRAAGEFPELTFFFQPADIVGQILNFGLPAPIDIQVAGADRATPNYDMVAQQIAERDRAQIPGVADVHLHQVVNVPRAARRRRPHAGRAARADAARRREQPAGLALVERPGAPELLGRSAQRRSVPRRGPDAAVQDRLASTALDDLPLSVDARRPSRSCSANLADRRARRDARIVNHYNVAAGVRRLRQRAGHATSAASARDIDRSPRRDPRRRCPAARTITMRGQVESMDVGVLAARASASSSRSCSSTC